ncbi:hypothetical protein Bind_1648 [Beijerinckia indica subsp. indica ATCC 9039]|uniref:Transcriptional regulator LmrA/YxaF-like C-terminal domain-containing protein n=2 Tax=Beijerinckia TaxID=532 RepID=B2IC24_BEII9|nr:hypothetical protein Bind_1648 [Beijerinckia indica subsp. indica ATCC 9039]
MVSLKINTLLAYYIYLTGYPMPVEKNKPDEMFEIAANMFRLHGYCDTDIDDISKKCSVNLSLMREIFNTKTNVALEIMSHIQNHFDFEILIHAYDKKLPAYIRIESLSKAIEDYFIKCNGGCVFIKFSIEQMNKDDAFVEPIKRYFDSLNDAYKEIFLEVYQPDQAVEVASRVVSDLQGALIMMRVDGDIWPLQQFTERLLTRLRADMSHM